MFNPFKAIANLFRKDKGKHSHNSSSSNDWQFSSTASQSSVKPMEFKPATNVSVVDNGDIWGDAPVKEIPTTNGYVQTGTGWPEKTITPAEPVAETVSEPVAEVAPEVVPEASETVSEPVAEAAVEVTPEAETTTEKDDNTDVTVTQ